MSGLNAGSSGLFGSGSGGGGGSVTGAQSGTGLMGPNVRLGINPLLAETQISLDAFDLFFTNVSDQIFASFIPDGVLVLGIHTLPFSPPADSPLVVYADGNDPSFTNAHIALYAAGENNAGLLFYRDSAFRYEMAVGAGTNNFSLYNNGTSGYAFYIDYTDGYFVIPETSLLINRTSSINDLFKLQVKGDAGGYAVNFEAANTAAVGVRSGGGTGQFFIGASLGAAKPDLIFSTNTLDEAARFNAADLALLIGRNSSSGSAFKLQVGDGNTDQRGLFTSSSNFALGLAQATAAPMYLGATADADPYILFSNNSGNELARIGGASHSFIIGDTAPEDPVYKLQVGNGGSDTRGLIMNNNQYAFAVANTDINHLAYLGIEGATSDLIFSSQSGTEVARVLNGGGFSAPDRGYGFNGDDGTALGVIAVFTTQLALITPNGSNIFFGESGNAASFGEFHGADHSLKLAGAIQTGGNTNQINFGGVQVGAVVLDAANYWEVEIDGVTKKILFAQ
jgi:hypothetical protein